MSLVALVMCSRGKLLNQAPARSLYTGDLFRAHYAYAQSRTERIFILSSKYGLLEPGQVVRPYELHLAALPVEVRQLWAKNVLRSLSERTDIENDNYLLLADQPYREFLVPALRHVEIPEDMPQADKIAWLEEKVREK